MLGYLFDGEVCIVEDNYFIHQIYQLIFNVV